MEDKDPWAEAAQTYASLLPSARYLTKAVLDQREDADNQRWLRSSLISIPTAAPEPAAGDPDSDLDDGESDGGGSVAGRVIARYRPDSAGRLRIEFGFLPEWAFTSTANTEAAVERFGEQLLPRSRYLTALLIANRRDSWLRSSLVQIPTAIQEPNELTINITSPVLEFRQREEVEARRIGTISGPLSDQLDPITISGTPPGLTLRATDTDDELLKRLILSRTAPTDDDAVRTYTVRITARPADGDPVSDSFTIRIIGGNGRQVVTWNGYSPDTEQIGERVTFRTPHVVEGPDRPEWSYSSDTPRLCTVDSRTGALTLVAVGQCQVSATSAAREGFREETVQTIVTVTDKPVPEIRWQGYDPLEAAVGERTPVFLPPTATVDGRSVRLDYTFEVDEDSERDGICGVNTRSGRINALAAGTCIVIAKSAETDDYAAAESDTVRIPITKEKLPPDLRWEGYDAENLRVGDDRIDPIDPEPGLREARGKLTYTYKTTTRSICDVDTRTGKITPYSQGDCEVTVMSEETDDFLADEVMVDVTVLGERGDPDLDWFRYPDSPTAGGNAIMPDRPSSRDRVGPLRYQSKTPDVCIVVESGSGRLRGLQANRPCQVTVTSEETDELREGSKTISVTFREEAPEIRSISCSPSRPEVDENVTCTARLSGGDPDTYSWSGGSSRGSSEEYRTSFSSSGRQTVRLTVRNAGGSDSDSTSVDVPEEPQAPEIRSISCSPSRPEVGDRVTCTASLSGGEPDTYSWSGGSSRGSSEEYRTSFSSSGRQTVRLTVRNASGSDDGSTSVDVPEEAPVIDSISCSPDDPEVDERVECTASLSGGEPDTYSWSGGSSSGSSEEYRTSFSSSGRHTVRLTVRNDGGSDDGSTSVDVPEEAPVINSISCPRTVEVDESVTCTASLSGGTPDTYSWSGGSSSGSSSSYSTSFSSSGRYTVSLTVRNGGGRDSGDSQEITVTTGNRPPEPDRSISGITVNEDASETITVSSYFRDPDGDSLSYSADSSPRNVVSVDVSGDRVTVEGRRVGSTTITVTADDGNGGTATQTFTATVENRPPERVGSIDDIELDDDDSTSIRVRSYFRDPDGHSLDYSAVSSQSSVVSVSVSGSRVTVESGRRAGSSTITVTADDSYGGTVTQTFTVTIEEGSEPPVIRSISCSPDSPEVGESVTCTARLSGGSPDTYEWIGGVSDGSSSSYRTSFSRYGRQLVFLEVSNDGGSDDERIYVGVLATPPFPAYARCGSDNIKVYLFDRTNDRKHHLNMTGEEATSLFGRSWWNTIGHMNQRACDSWPTGTARTAADFR